MPCEICNHTVNNIGVEGRRIFWCPRCGTLRTENGDFINSESPWLVKRVRMSADGGQICSLDRKNTWFAITQLHWTAILEAVGYMFKIY
jgi:hypothetical protein